MILPAGIGKFDFYLFRCLFISAFLLFCSIASHLSAQSFLDPSFNGKGFRRYSYLTDSVFFNGSPERLFALPGNKSLVVSDLYGASSNEILLMRLDSNGRPDQTFGKEGRKWGYLQLDNANMTDIKQIKGDYILLAGRYWDTPNYKPFFQKIKPDGNRDSSFGINGLQMTPSGFPDYTVYQTLVCGTSDNKIFTTHVTNDTMYRYLYVKLKSNGQIDSSFGQNGIIKISRDWESGNINLVGLYEAPDKKVYLHYNIYGVGIRNRIYRLNEDGSPDLSFGYNGHSEDIMADGYTGQLLVLPNGKIIVYTDSGENIRMFCIGSDGFRDTGFGDYGIFSLQAGGVFPYPIAVCADSKYIFGLVYMRSSGLRDFVFRVSLKGEIDTAYGDFGRLEPQLPLSGDYISFHACLKSNHRLEILGTYTDISGSFGEMIMYRLLSKPLEIKPKPIFTETLRVYPNPASDSINLFFRVQTPGIYSMNVYDAVGNLVATPLMPVWLISGTRTLTWHFNRQLKTGTYFLELKGGNIKKVEKIIIR